jgi:hypothetical protein
MAHLSTFAGYGGTETGAWDRAAQSRGELARGTGRHRKWRRAGQRRTDGGLSRPCLIGAARAPPSGERPRDRSLSGGRYFSGGE